MLCVIRPHWGSALTHSIDYLRSAFEHMADVAAEQSPLYQSLSRSIAGDDAVLALCQGGQPRQPPANLLFGAVQYLLLSGIRHDLAGYYRSLGGSLPAADAYPAFADFCRTHADAIVAIINTRRVQTNEVGRCGVLLPGFVRAADHFDQRPLHLIEVGSSAGLLQLFDRYQYAYHVNSSDGAAISTMSTDKAASICVEVRSGSASHIPRRFPTVSDRIGIDIAPIDVGDDEAIRWLAALIWPDEVDRHRLLQAAVSIARQHPPRILQGDGLALADQLIEQAPSDVVPCVFDSHAIHQMPSEWRAKFAAMLQQWGAQRDLAHVSLEWLNDDPGPFLRLDLWRGGVHEHLDLAECHHHGKWMRFDFRLSPRTSC